MGKPPAAKAASTQSRTLHRAVGTIIGVLVLYFAVTGTTVQLIDLKTLLSHAPANDPNMQAIRESIDGPGSYAVIDTPDYDAPALPVGLVSSQRLEQILSAARAADGAAPVKFVELRMIDHRPVGQVMTDTLLRFDAQTLRAIPVPHSGRHGPSPSQHLSMKNWHRLFALTDWVLWLNALVGIGLGFMIVTGMVLYFRLWLARAALNKTGLFWSSGQWWKTCHRGVALIASVFISVVAVSGTLLAVDSFALQVYKTTHPSDLFHGVAPMGMVGDFSSPLPDKVVPGMLQTTLAAYAKAEGSRPIKAIRLRYFSGMPQGIVIAGGPETEQLAFNAATGAPVTSTEPGYPYMGFPFGWREHELMKRIHRGDILGIPGRIMDLLAGLSLIYLSASGLWMIFDQWRRRRKLGRHGLFWS